MEEQKNQNSETPIGDGVETVVMPLKWQLVSEGLPPERTKCLIYGRWQEYTKVKKELKGDYTILTIGIFANTLWHRKDYLREWHSYQSDKITHYIVIPELPL